MDSIITTLLTPTIRNGMTAIGGALVTAGILHAPDVTIFSNIATGIVVGGGGFIWSWFTAHRNAAIKKAAANAGAVLPSGKPITH